MATRHIVRDGDTLYRPDGRRITLPPRAAQRSETHVYLHSAPQAPTRTKTQDAALRDQRRVLARLRRKGSDWSVEDEGGKPFTGVSVRTGSDGELEIIHHPEEGSEDEQAELGIRSPLDPGATGRFETIGEAPGGGFAGSGSGAIGGTEDRRRAADRELLRPDRRGVGTVAGNLAMQRELDRVYGGR
jgi:hypothetical protein